MSGTLGFFATITSFPPFVHTRKVLPKKLKSASPAAPRMLSSFPIPTASRTHVSTVNGPSSVIASFTNESLFPSSSSTGRNALPICSISAFNAPSFSPNTAPSFSSTGPSSSSFGTTFPFTAATTAAAPSLKLLIASSARLRCTADKSGHNGSSFSGTAASPASASSLTAASPDFT